MRHPAPAVVSLLSVRPLRSPPPAPKALRAFTGFLHQISYTHDLGTSIRDFYGSGSSRSCPSHARIPVVAIVVKSTRDESAASANFPSKIIIPISQKPRKNLLGLPAAKIYLSPKSQKWHERRQRRPTADVLDAFEYSGYGEHDRKRQTTLLHFPLDIHCFANNIRLNPRRIKIRLDSN